MQYSHTQDPLTQDPMRLVVIVCLLFMRQATMEHASRVECSFLLVQGWKLMAIKQQLQVTNHRSLGESQAEKHVIANIKWYNRQCQT